MELKEIFGEELANQLASSTDETVKKAVTVLSEKKLVLDDGKLVPQYRVKELSDEIKQHKEQLKKSEDDLKALKEKAAGNAEFQSQITELQRANKQAKEEFEANQLRSKKSTALLVALMDNGVVDATAREVLSKNFDLNKIELDDNGKAKDFDSLLKPIKDNPAFKGMFGAVKRSGNEHVNGEPVGDFFTREDVKAHDGDLAWMRANLEKIDKSMKTWT